MKASLPIGLVALFAASCAEQDFSGYPSATSVPMAEVAPTSLERELAPLREALDREGHCSEIDGLLTTIGEDHLEPVREIFVDAFARRWLQEDAFALFSWWAAFDPEGALVGAAELEAFHRIAATQAVFQTWASRDPAAAWASVDDSDLGVPKGLVAEAVVEGIASTGTPALQTWFEGIEASNPLFEEVAHLTAAALFKGDADVGIAWLEAGAPAAMRGQLSETIGALWAQESPESVIRWGETLPVDIAPGVIAAAVETWAGQSVYAAGTFLASATQEAVWYRESVDRFVATLSDHNPEWALRWTLADLPPGTVRTEVVRGLAINHGAGRMLLSLEWEGIGLSPGERAVFADLVIGSVQSTLPESP